MVTKTLDVRDSRLSLKELLAQVREGTEIILIDGDRPVARLIPATEEKVALKQRQPGLHPGSMVMSDDFDDPLPDEFWLGQG